MSLAPVSGEQFLSQAGKPRGGDTHIFLFSAENFKSRSRGDRGAREALSQEFPHLPATSFPSMSLLI